MIEHKGIITGIDESHIRVLIIQQSACSGCHAHGACSAADKDEKIIDVESSDSSFKVGDNVVLYGESSMGLLAVLLAFVFPFLLILVTLFILTLFIDSEIISGIVALAVLVPYFSILSLFKLKFKSKFQFHIKNEFPE